MTINMTLKEQVENHLTDRRYTDNTKLAVTLLGMNHKVSAVANLAELKEANVSRIQTQHKDLITSLQVQYDQHCVDNLDVNDPDYRVSKNVKTQKPKTVLLSEAKALDHIYYELLVQTVRDPQEKVSTRISSYKELQQLLKRIEDGDSSVKAEVEEEEVNSNLNSNNDPADLFKYLTK